MADDGSGEKTEDPTEKKVQGARKKGQVWKSRELTSTFVFVAGFGAMAAAVPTLYEKVRELFADAFARVQSPSADPATDVAAMLYSGLIGLAVMSAPVILAAAVAGGLGDFLQVGSLFATEPVMPKLDKLNPIQGLKNLFSKKQFVELIKSTLKLLLAAYLAYGVMRDEVRLVVVTATATPGQIGMVTGHLIYEMTKSTAMLLVVVSIFDLWWQHRSYTKDLMMTKDEVKREYKESEGDPHHKAKRKQMHQEILASAQKEDVRSSQFVVTNPDHIAIAIKYSKDKDNAPKVVAKGVNVKAEEIKRIAREAGVPVLRNVVLAQALNRIEIGDEIPEDLYDAVAEVLNFVYGLSKEET